MLGSFSEFLKKNERYGVRLDLAFNQNPTQFYKKYYTNGCVTYVGRIDHYSHYKESERDDSTFLEFCSEKKIEVPNSYRWANANIESGYYSSAKYDRLQPDFSDEDLLLIKGASVFLENHFAFCKDSRVSSLDEVLLNLNKMSSPGFPWTKISACQNKKQLIEKVGLQFVHEHWDDLLYFNYSPVMWKSSIKTELRDSEKLNHVPPKLRTFTASPIEHSINLSRLCLDFNNKFYDSALKTWSFVGASMYMRGFNSVYEKLSKHRNCFELDESSYDCSINRKFFSVVMEFRWLCLNPSERTVHNRIRLENLYRDIVHSLILLDSGEIIFKHTGNPSGSANTIVDNTLVLYLLLAYAYLRLCPQGEVCNQNHFEQNVAAVLNGDDNTFSVSDGIVDWFNAKSIIACWSRIGVVASSGTGKVEASPLCDVKFISHGFKVMQRCVYPCPEYDRVICSMAYGCKVNSPLFSLLRAYALRLTSFANEEARELLCRYITWLWQNKYYELQGSVIVSGVELSSEEIKGVYKSDIEIQHLYEGTESIVPVQTTKRLWEQKFDYIEELEELDITYMVKQSGKRNADLGSDLKHLQRDVVAVARDIRDTVVDIPTVVAKGARRIFSSPKGSKQKALVPPSGPKRGVVRSFVKKLNAKNGLKSAKKLRFSNSKLIPSASTTHSDSVTAPTSVLKVGAFGQFVRPDGVHRLYNLRETAFDPSKTYTVADQKWNSNTNQWENIGFDPVDGVSIETFVREGLDPNYPVGGSRASIISQPGSVIHHDSIYDPKRHQQFADSLAAGRKAMGYPDPMWPLVGVEPNPGPKGKKSKKAKVKARIQRPMMLNAPAAPVAMGYQFINNNKMKNTRVKHVEQVQEIKAKTASYNLQISYNLNPGLNQVFPWLAGVAAQYEAYEFKEITFIYMPYTATSTTGYVAMNCDYNPQDDDVSEFSTKQAFIDYDGAVQGNAWESMVFRVKCPNPEGPKRRSMRYGALTGSYDLHNYDHATFNFATGGSSVADDTPIGTLFVHYVVELARPRVAVVSGATGFAHYYATTGVDATHSMGTAQVTSADNIPVTIGTQLITFNRVGKYYCDYQLTGTVLVGVSSNWLSSSDAKSSVSKPTGSNGQTIVNSGATDLASEGLYVTVNTVGATVVMNPITSGTTFTRADLFICQIPSSLSVPRPFLDRKVEELEEKIRRLEEDQKENDEIITRYYPSSSSSSSSAAGSTIPSPVSKGDWDNISRRSLGRR